MNVVVACMLLVYISAW